MLTPRFKVNLPEDMKEVWVNYFAHFLKSFTYYLHTVSSPSSVVSLNILPGTEKSPLSGRNIIVGMLLKDSALEEFAERIQKEYCE